MTRQGSESDSEASDVQSGPGPGIFRVRVNMKRFFSDERALAYVCVSARHRVRWLQQRLAARFSLPPHLLLLSRGHLLPPAEPLAVLRPDDPVDVLPAPPPADATVPSLDHTDALDSGVVNFVSELPDRDEEDELSASKLCALRMLEQYCGEQTQRSDSRPRRRRVRRRRRPAPYDADGEPAAERQTNGEETVPDRDDGEPTATFDELQVSPNSLQTATVLRNGSQKTRTPRVVRALGYEK